jgi:predicted LPLAT superfamily acyltransferase
MPRWKGQSRGNVLGYSIFIFFLRTFGLGFAYLFLAFVSFYYFLFTNKEHPFYYFRMIHKFSFLKTIISIYLNYFTFGKTILDKTAMLSGISTDFTYNFENEDYIRNMKDGGILISAHVGNWEIAGQLLNRIETKFNILMFDAEHQRIKQFFDKTFTEKNFNIIVIKDDLSHVFEINRALKANELLCMHGDRFISADDTLEIDFLGEKALFPKGPFYLASRYNVPVSYVFAMKESSKHYHFSATPPKFYYSESSRTEMKSNIEKAMKDYIFELEKIVREYPLQWFNYYKFWN